MLQMNIIMGSEVKFNIFFEMLTGENIIFIKLKHSGHKIVPLIQFLLLRVTSKAIFDKVL